MIATTDSHLHITIASNAHKGIALYFWKSMGYDLGINHINHFVDVELVDIGMNWCADSEDAYYAPFLVMPFVFNVHSVAPTDQIQLDPLYSWNSMAAIKPMLTEVGAPRNCLLYLSREIGRHRDVENEEEVLQYLGEWAGDHSLELRVRHSTHCSTFEQLEAEKKLFSGAMVLVGPHGGSFGNMMFMQSGSFVVEFNGWLNRNNRPYFYALAQANALHYHYVAPQPFDYDNDFTVNIQQLGQVMAAVGDSLKSQ